MDVFVHPGAPEPFGLVNLEAMAMARPVVGFAHGALPEIVRDRETGFLVEPYNSGALAEAIRELLDSPEQRQAMGISGHRRAGAHFNVRQTAQRLENLYSNIVRDNVREARHNE